MRVVAPEVLSFSSNGPATLRFFRELKSAIFTRTPVKKDGKYIKRTTSLDLSAVERISVPVAVVLGAELHRWAISRKSGLQVRSMSDWAPRLRTLLTTLGVFELLQIEIKDRRSESEGEIVLLKMKSDEKRDGAAVQALQEHVRNLASKYESKKYVFDAVDEAVVNCLDHGYIDIGEKPLFPYAGHRWWATSCFDPVNGSVRFFVYDQGVGIPKSLPRNDDIWPQAHQLLKKLMRAPFEAEIIESAFEVGRTRTKEARRGKGLDKMHRAIRLSENGYLRVISGCGDVTMGPSSTLKKNDHDSHIGGTLVEWSIPINV